MCYWNLCCQLCTDLPESKYNGFKDTQPVGAIVSCCRTLDQGKALLKFIDAISEKSLKTTAVMTAGMTRIYDKRIYSI